MEISINYFAVLVSAIVGFGIGWAWYGPLFGKTWKSLMGFTDDSMKNMPLSPYWAMGLGFLSTLVIASVLACFVDRVLATTFFDAVGLGFWVWLGFVATIQLGDVLWNGRPFKLYILNSAHYLVVILTMTIILTLWS